MSKRRCQLCGGKLSGNICTECGLDNSKNDENYRREREACWDQPMTHIHDDDESPYSGKMVQKKTKAEKRQEKQEAQERKAAQKKREAEQKAYSASSPTRTSTTYSSAKGQKKKKKKGPIYWIVLFIIIVNVFGSLLGSCVEAVQSGLGDLFSDSEEIHNEEYVLEPPITSDTYANVTRELSQTGEAYETVLEAGLYVGGVHIPEGTYTFTLEEGEGSVILGDEANCIHINMQFGFGTEEWEKNMIQEQDDVRIYDGAILEIDGNTVLRLESQNAQEVHGMENPNTEEGTFTDEIVVGKDITAGVYDVTCEEGSGIFEYYVPVKDADYESYEGKLIGGDESDFPKTLKNIVLPDGVTVTITDMKVTLTPSEWIVNEDYDNFYNK